MTTTSEGPAETERLAGELAAELGPGDVVLVSGDLGSGKTTFVRGACRQLGVNEPVTSPTFTIGHAYAGELPVFHLDLYRLGSLEPEEPGLLDDYFGADAITFVEWPAVAGGELGDGERVAVRVELRHLGGDRRGLTITHGPAT